MNSFLTVAESLKISYMKNDVFVEQHNAKLCKYDVIFNVGHGLRVKFDS